MSSTFNNIHIRERYLEQIKPFMNSPLIKVITGQRRVGKSYILLQLIELIKKDEHKPNIIVINKEDYQFTHIKNDADLDAEIAPRLTQNRKNYIFIDEVQEITDFHLVIRSLALDSNNDIYITGSNSNIFAGDLANSLGGRTIQFRVYSLSYLEFLQFHNLSNNDESLEQYLHFGGLPGLMHYPLTESICMEYLRNLYSTIVLRDVIGRMKIRNSSFLEQLILFFADNIGSLFSAKSISDYLKSQRISIAASQVKDYADALADAFIIERASRYDIKGKRLFEYGEKYYFENLGIRNALIGYQAQDRAKRLENIVFNHLLFCGYDVKVGSIGSEEIDFVCTRDHETIYIQVALELSTEKTIAREFGNLEQIKDNYPKLVISADQNFGKSYKGIQHIYIRDFLSSSMRNLKL